eukprot:gnl/TRDRNA2_/TRDRNA2_142292_c0_seq1.p1 gnl/TRDRNA2_/TRDRNA2_142292_c0~~gnl/TRDRNA2_/TRDRNA2_142292_c0_seq1.p1  ORF type:complete len:306 (+),score=77.95 gnl/TRDRNA2_/TRDRNA2_142292_c0_seq1:62-979(+)
MDVAHHADSAAEWPLQAKTFSISVKSALSGDVLAVLQCRADDTVYVMRRAAEEASSRLFACLMFDGQVLMDCDTLEFCGARDPMHVDAVTVSAEEAEWISMVQQGYGLMKVPTHLQSSKAIVLAAVRKNGDAIRRCCAALKSDTQVILTAVNSSTEAVKYLQRSMADVAKELKEKGYNAERLKRLSFSAKHLWEIGYTLSELRAIGFTVGQLKESQFTVEQLTQEGYTLSQLKQGGFTPKELLDAGFAAKPLRDEGFTVQQLKLSGLSFAELMEAGFALEDFVPFLAPLRWWPCPLSSKLQGTMA